MNSVFLVVRKDELEAVQRTGTSSFVWYCAHGAEDALHGGNLKKSLCIRFSTEPAGACTVPFVPMLDDGSEHAFYVSQAGYEALNSDWCGQPVLHIRHSSLHTTLEATQLEAGGATLVA